MCITISIGISTHELHFIIEMVHLEIMFIKMITLAAGLMI